MQRIPFIYFPLEIARKFTNKGSFLVNALLHLEPNLETNLRTTDLNIKLNTYVVLVFLNALSWFFFSSIFLFILVYLVGERTIIETSLYAIGLGFFLFLLMLMLTIKYPKIIAGKKSEDINTNLVFSLKDLLLQLTAGVPLFNAMVKISEEDYGEVSLEFKKTVKDIQLGIPIDKALEKMALRSQSEYLKKTIWQIINILKSGSNLNISLRVIINELLNNHRTKIQNYAQELNMWSLIYMMFAVAIPTIGSTLMLIMTSFSGAGISNSTFILFGVICLFVQYVIIGLMASRRPAI